jgi:hypothetical protein
MGGCLRSLGCLVLLVILAIGGWITRDRWWPALTGASPEVSTVTFDAVTAERRTRSRSVVQSLAKSSGPVFANLTAAEALALVLGDARSGVPAFVGPLEGAVQGDRLLVRSTVDPSALRGIEALKPIVALLDSRPRVTLGGTLEVVEPGQGAFVVRDVRVNDLIVPAPAIAPLLRQLDRRPRPSGAPDRAITFPLPAHVADLRVAKGRVTLYKNVP